MPRSRPLTVTLGTSRALARAPRSSAVAVVAASPGIGRSPIAGRTLGRAEALGSPGECEIGWSVAVTTYVATARWWVALLTDRIEKRGIACRARWSPREDPVAGRRPRTRNRRPREPGAAAIAGRRGGGYGAAMNHLSKRPWPFESPAALSPPK